MSKACNIEDIYLHNWFRRIFDVNKYPFAKQDYRYVGFVQGNLVVATVEDSVTLKMLEVNTKGMAALYYRLNKSKTDEDIIETISDNIVKITFNSI